VNKYTALIEIGKRPATEVQVMYDRKTNAKNSPYKITDMYHVIKHLDGTQTITNMCHIQNDVMTSGLFAALRVQIEHQIEVIRKLTIVVEEA